MRALRIHGYGGPEVMRLDEVEAPRPAPGEVLVRVRAASVNPIDWKMRRGLLAGVFPLSFPRILGRDCAGEVDGGMHAGVAALRGEGTHAQYAALPDSQCAPVPEGLEPAAAASLCVSGLSAYIALVEVAKVSPGMKVLIHAGAGGVGSLAIQIARHLGAEVVATASAANRAYCEGLGASRVVDYRREDFAAAGPFDVVLDSIGGETHVRSIAALAPGGRVVALQAAPIPEGTDKSLAVMAQIQPTRERLERIFAWAAAGVLRPQVTQAFSLEQAAQAYALSEAGHLRGKIVILP
jgi:NADPH:quinone reductase-like Zn-dependent oxidoreductase